MYSTPTILSYGIFTAVQRKTYVHSIYYGIGTRNCFKNFKTEYMDKSEKILINLHSTKDLIDLSKLYSFN